MSDFFRFLFSKVTIKSVRLARKVEKGAEAEAKALELRNSIVLCVTYIMAFAFVSSLVVAFWFLISRPGQEVPSIVQDILFTTLGYFGGAFAAFMKIQS